MNFEIIKSILEKELSYLKQDYGVSELAVFGSYATGNESDASDIDILVQFDKPIGLFKFTNLKFYLEKKLDKKVDLVTKKP